MINTITYVYFFCLQFLHRLLEKQQYVKLFKDWSIAFTSEADLYLMRFDKNAKRKVVTTNVTIKHFLRTLTNDDEDNNSNNKNNKNSNNNKGDFNRENILRNIHFTNIRYHNVSSKLILLSNHGRLYTFDTRTLRVSYLRISAKIIDFSINEISNVLYYVTSVDNGLLCVMRVNLIVSNDDVSVDDSIAFTVLSLYTTHVTRSRLTLDYPRESLYLFVLINERMFTYEMKLSDESRALLQLCGGSCSRNRKLQILRPWLAGDGNDEMFNGNHRFCKSLNFFVSRDRLLDLEMICPAFSSNVYRVEISRKSNWAQDFRRSNYTTREQNAEYMYSSLIDVNDLTIASNFVPLRLTVMKDRSNGTRYVHVEHVIYSNQEELEHHRAPSNERLSHANRRLLAQIDHAWANVHNVDSMYVRSEQLFNELPFLINLMLKHRAVRKYHKLLNEVKMNETRRNIVGVTSATTVATSDVIRSTIKTMDKETGIEYDKIPTINERAKIRDSTIDVRDNDNDKSSNDDHRETYPETHGMVPLIILMSLLIVYALFSTAMNVTHVRKLRKQSYEMRQILSCLDTIDSNEKKQFQQSKQEDDEENEKEKKEENRQYRHQQLKSNDDTLLYNTLV